MKINKMLKLTLSALLLAASSSAYAQEGAVVKLKNGQTVTWQTFANAINDPSTIKAEAPADITEALNQAKVGVETATNNVTAAETRFSEAQSLAKTAAESLSAAAAAYTEANNTVESLKAEREPLKRNYDSLSTTIDEKQRTKNANNGRIQELQIALNRLPTKTVTTTVSWLNDIYNAATNYKTILDNAFKTETNAEASIWYKITESSSWGGKKIYTINFSFSAYDDYIECTTTDELGAALMNSDKTPTKANVYLGPNYTDNSDGLLTVTMPTDISSIIDNTVTAIQQVCTLPKYTESKTEYEDPAAAEDLNNQIQTLTTTNENLQNEIDAATTSQSAIKNELDVIDAKLDEYTLKQESTGTTKLQDLLKAQQDAQAEKTQADTDVTNAKTALDDAKTALTEANTTLTAAQDAYDNAVAEANASALENYKEVSLVGNVTADVRINTYNGWIDGGGNVITLGSIDALFNTISNSTLLNFAVNGKITNSRGENVAVNNVTYWINNTNKGVFYNEEGTKAEFTSLGELGFAVRNDFGVDFINGTSALTKFSEDTKVYNITVYQPSTTNSFKYYVNLKDGKFYSNGAEITLEPNAFIKSESADIEGMDNVIINGNECASVVITDKKPFFAPFEIQAENVTYNRTFTPGFNTVCLPFNLSKDLDSNIGGVFEYDAETAEKFWFTMIDGSIPANTPALLNTTAGFNDLILNNITIAATPKTQLTEGGSANDGLSKSHGTFKSVNAGQFLGQSQANKVYGLKVGTSTFEPAGANANFPAFRMVISSELAAQNNTLRTPRQLGIRDSKGIEITDQFTTGIESVQADASSLNVTTGVNEIIITSEADYGKVNIHSIDGKLVTVANVTAGTTTVNVNSGIYIVLGKKVMVK